MVRRPQLPLVLTPFSAAPAPARDDARCAVVERYQPLLLCSFAAGGALVAMELPWLRILAALPDALARRKYGAS